MFLLWFITIYNENINFRYENENVLKNFSLEVPKGKTIALVGQSGSGKSTLCSIINGYIPCDNNMIYINDVDINNLDHNSSGGKTETSPKEPELSS